MSNAANMSTQSAYRSKNYTKSQATWISKIVGLEINPAEMFIGGFEEMTCFREMRNFSETGMILPVAVWNSKSNGYPIQESVQVLVCLWFRDS